MPKLQQGTKEQVRQSFVEAKMFLEFPLAVIGKHAEEGAHSLTFEDEITDQSTKERVARRITVTSGKFGLPIAGDMDVLLALMILTSQRNKFRKQKLEFSLCEVCRLLQWPVDDGRRMKLLKNAIARWLGVTVYFENARRVDGQWISIEGIHLLERVKLSNTREYRDHNVDQFLKWNEVVLEAMQAGFISLDWNFYLSLKSATAKRLYRFLSKRFEQGSHWPPYGLEAFAVNKVGLRNGQRVAEYKKTMWKGMSELMERGFLHKEARKEVFIGRGDHTKVQFKRARTWRELTKAKAADVKKGNPNELEDKLISLGVARGRKTATSAGALVESCSDEKIKLCIAFHEEELKNTVDKRPGVGKLIASIRSESQRGFVPEKFETQEEKASKRKVIEQKKAEERERLRLDEEEQKRNDDEARNQFRDYRSQFSETEQIRLEDEALAEETSFFVGRVMEARKDGTDDGMFHQLLWEKHIIPKLNQNRESAA